MSIAKYAVMMVDIHETLYSKLFEEELNKPQAIEDTIQELSLVYPPKLLEQGIAEIGGGMLDLTKDDLWRFLKNTDYPMNMLEETFVERVMYNTRQKFSELYIRSLYNRFFRSGKTDK